MCGRTGAALAILVSLFVPAVAAADRVPAVIPSAYSPWPEWVAADVAVASDGTLRADVLGQFTSSLRNLARANSARLLREAGTNVDGNGAGCDECRLFRGTSPHVVRVRSLDELTAVATDIVAGEVAAIREGFYGGQPGSLILLSGRYLKGAASDQPLLFYPYAKIKTAHGMICAKPVGEFQVPRVGDKMIFFAMGTPRNEAGPAVFTIDVVRELVHEPQDGPIHVPGVFRSIAAGRAPFATIERAISDALERAARAR